MIGPVEQSGPQQSGPQRAEAGGDGAWATTLATSVPMIAGPRGTVGGTLAGPPHGLLAGTVTPDQVRRGLAQSMPPEAVEAALSAAIKHRAAGGRALRAAIDTHAASGAPGTAAVAQALIERVRDAEPVSAAGPAVRSLMHASDEGRLRMDPAGQAVLTAFFESRGYGPELALALPSGLPFNITEADQVGAHLLARASGSWHPDAAHPKPAAARVPIAVIDDGFNVAHPLLATKIVPAAHRDAARTRKDTPYTHPAPTASRHGTAMAVIATGRTHVAEAIVFRDVTLNGRPFEIPRVIKRAAEEASIVSMSSTAVSVEPQHQAGLSDEIAVALRKNRGSLLVLPSGNYAAGETAARAEANLRVSRERNVLTVGGYHEPDELSPRRYVGHPTLVHTLAPAEALVPGVAAASDMALERGTSISTATVANLVAMMSALAPHLPAPRLKGLVEGTSYQTIACMMADPKPSAFGVVASERALRLAAVAGLVVSGTTDPVRTRTIAEAEGARQDRAGGGQGVAPGMTAEQAADALKLGGMERAEALADHARLLGAAGA